MDPADRAQEDAERYAPHILQASMKPKGPEATGFCAFCNEELPDKELRFCDSDCRDDYEIAEKRRKINGTT